MGEEIAIGFVVYYPGKEIVSKIKTILSMDLRIFIFDNSPEQEMVRLLCREAGNEKCMYITCGKNVGLGFALSTICSQAYYESNSALLFFDQDTGFNSKTIEYIKDFYCQNKNILAEYSSIMFNSKYLENAENHTKFENREVLLSINSGSMFILENLKKLHWHNIKYFVDCVDYEYCLSSSNHGFKIGLCQLAPGFDHESEQGDTRYLVFGKIRRLRKYPRKRVLGTVIASSKLILRSLRARNSKFFWAMCKSLAGYFFWQIVVRLSVNLKFGKRIVE